MDNSDHVFNILARIGWQENTKYSKTEIIDFIKQEGYEAYDCVVEFLLKFMGTKILFHNKRNGLKNDDIDFDFEKATHIEVPERVSENYSPRVGKPLCLIGTAYRDYMVLVMSSDGNVYGGYDDFLCKIGSSGLEAIEAIINDAEFEEISF